MTLAELRTGFKASALIMAESISSLGGSPDAIVDATMREAVAEFSAASPHITSKPFTYSGAVVTLDSWDAYSRVLSVEAPTGDIPPTYVDQRDIYVDPDDGKVGFVDLASGTACKVRYTVVHTIPATPASSDAVTIPATRLKAFYYLIAAMLAEKLAARHAEENRAVISDITDHQSKSREYLNIAKEFRRQFRAQIGVSAADVTPVGAESVIEYGQPNYRMPW